MCPRLFFMTVGFMFAGLIRQLYPVTMPGPESGIFFEQKMDKIEQKIDEMKGVYASPTAAAGRIYFVGRKGVSYVLKPSDKFEVLAINTLDDKIDCSPAFVGDEMYLKGKQNLYCISASK